MNLVMPPEIINRLIARGARAGDELLTWDQETWDVHRRVRYRIAMARLSEALETFRHHYTHGGYADLLSPKPWPTGPANTFFDGDTWRLLDHEATEALLNVVSEWEQAGWPAVSRPWPSPSPAIRMAPE